MEKNLPEVNILRGLDLLGLNGKGTVTLITRIIRGNTLKVFQEKAKNSVHSDEKKEQPPKIRLNFSISETAQKMRRRQ